MKRIRVVLLALVLSVSMLAPGMSMFPVVYAQDAAKQVTQPADETAGVPAAGPAEKQTGEQAGDSGAGGQNGELGTGDSTGDPNADDPAGDEAGELGAGEQAGEQGAGEQADELGAREQADELGAGDQAGDPGSDQAGSGQGREDTEGEAAGENGAGGQNGETGADPAGDPNADDPADADDPQDEFESYGTNFFTNLDDEKAVVIPEGMQDKITVSHTHYGNGLLLTGKVADLNSTYITIDRTFDFDSGSVGRLCFDGLKDKDRGMTVEVEVYIDDRKTPNAVVPLRKQMGSQDWANNGEQSVTLGDADITGKHRVALLLKISGKKDTSETSVMIRSMRFCKTTIPVMYFNIDESEGTVEAMNNSEDHSVECYGTVDLIVPNKFNADETFRDEYGPQESLRDLELEYIRGRGNSTWDSDKKPYKVKFDKKQDLFGFGENAHWTLIANRYDNSLIRNRMTYWLGQQLGMEYTPQCVPVEVVMNGKFYGSYLLCEQIRVGEGRVEIDNLDKINDPPAVTDELIQTGGYLLSLDSYGEEERTFTTEHGMTVFIESPEDNAPYYYDYIKAYTQKVEDAIFDDNFVDAEGVSYTEYLDLDAAVDYWWIQEFSMNGDAYGSGSTYLYKKRIKDEDKGKIYWGPLWDFDLVAWGDLDYDEEPQETLEYTQTPWLQRMKADPEFINAIRARWSEEYDMDGEAPEGGYLKDRLEEITAEGGRLDKYIAQMETTYDYDHELYGAYQSELTEYEGEIEQLRGWINSRISYVDSVMKDFSADQHHVTFLVDGNTVKEVDVVGILRESDFPDEPVKPGARFAGWEDEDGNSYDPGSRVTEDLTLTAVFSIEEEGVAPEHIYFSSYDIYVPTLIEPGDSDYAEWVPVNYQVMPVNAQYTDIVWTSSDEEVADPENGGAYVKKYGEATITATLENGVTASYDLHIVPYEDIDDWEASSFNKESMTLKPGEYGQILIELTPVSCESPEYIWVSVDQKIATVDDIGVVTAVAPGTTDILAVDESSHEVLRCRVTVKPASNKGRVVTSGGSKYQITSDKKGSRTAMLIKAKNSAAVTIPATIKLDGKRYSVNRIKAKAFARSKATKIVVKTKKMTKNRVRNSLKGSKVRKIKVSLGAKVVNKKYIKTYKKLFAKKNSGKTVKVY